MRKTITVPFDPAEYLDTPETISAYLAEAIAHGDAEGIREAGRTIARAIERLAIQREQGAEQ